MNQTNFILKLALNIDIISFLLDEWGNHCSENFSHVPELPRSGSFTPRNSYFWEQDFIQLSAVLEDQEKREESQGRW